MVFLSCLGGEEREIKFENKTAVAVLVTFQGTRLRLERGETKGLGTREDLPPFHVKIEDDDAGIVILDKTFTWEALREAGFRVVIPAEGR